MNLHTKANVAVPGDVVEQSGVYIPGPVALFVADAIEMIVPRRRSAFNSDERCTIMALTDFLESCKGAIFAEEEGRGPAAIEAAAGRSGGDAPATLVSLMDGGH